MPLFNDEELERVLSAHEGGQLAPFGADWFRPDVNHGCLIQVGKLISNCLVALEFFPGPARWFDHNYESTWTTDRFLRELIKQGVA